MTKAPTVGHAASWPSAAELKREMEALREEVRACQARKGVSQMIRIAITAAAYEAIVAGRPECNLLPPQEAPGGQFYLWLFQPLMERLKAARAPGESYSDTILRLAAE